jgi:hypothetical protein
MRVRRSKKEKKCCFQSKENCLITREWYTKNRGEKIYNEYRRLIGYDLEVKSNRPEDRLDKGDMGLML